MALKNREVVMPKATIEEYYKMRTSLKYWFLGKEYFKAAKALSFAAKYHRGTRKDKITPEFEHQVSIACFARTIASCFIRPEETFIVILLHDISEDYNVPTETFNMMYNKEVADAVWLTTKKFNGSVKDNATYYSEMGNCPIASIVKGIDRIHNIQTIHEVFSEEKQMLYIKETEDLVLPMIKKARNLFPEQEEAYENIKHALKTNISLIKAIHNSKKESKEEG
jgi:(p)ppGpp synthase/HD superfamily hydrolase